MLVDRWRWLVVGVVVAAVALVAVRLGDRGEAGPEPVRIAVGAGRLLCAEVLAVPAEASSDGLQRGPDPEFVQDPRCDDLAAAAPGPREAVLQRHSEADDAVGNVVLAGELRFDAQQRCFYVVADDEPIGVVWPARFIGKVDPPRITDEDRSTVFAVGDRFEVRGRYVSDAGDECGPVDADSSGFIASGDIVLVSG